MNGFHALLVALRAAGKLQPGRIVEVTVLHDANCSKLKGGICNCTPTIGEETTEPNSEEGQHEQ